MDNDDKETLEEYMEYFKKEPLKEKQSIIYEQLKMLASFTNDMCNEFNIPNEMIINKELLDLHNDNYTEDDFAEAVIVLVNSIQNSICDYSNGIGDLLDKLNTEQN